MSYHPEPLHLPEELPPALTRLQEHLARLGHQRWTQQRRREGWRVGALRDGRARIEPWLLPFDELPDEARERSLATAADTLHATLALGYRIVPPTDNGAVHGRDLAERIAHNRDHDMGPLLDAWNRREGGGWSDSVQTYRRLGERLLDMGEYLFAYDLIDEGLRRLDSADLPLRQLRALALLRAGATQQAVAALESLREETTAGADNETAATLGLVARTSKERWLHDSDGVAGAAHLQVAYEAYRRAHQLEPRSWTGINAATLGLISGDRRRAHGYARDARALALRTLTRLDNLPGGDEADTEQRYYALATLGEAGLVLGDLGAAAARYREAVAMDCNQHGRIAATRRNAGLLLRHLGRDEGMLAQCFPLPRVVLFAGHMLDRDDREMARFPATMETSIKDALREYLAPLTPLIGYSSAACGADILFLETVLELGGQIHIVLPYGESEFVADCVDITENGNWASRFQELVEHAIRVTTVSPHRVATSALSYEYANQVQLGMARDQATQLGVPLAPLAVWDGLVEELPGGTAAVISSWVRQGLDFDWVEIDQCHDGTPRLHRKSADEYRETFIRLPMRDDRAPGTRVRSMLFADVRGFSRLRDDQTPRFMEHFLGLVGRLTDRLDDGLLLRNTWGDGLFLVFADVEQAGQFALELRDAVRDAPWADYGLPEDLSIRIALHAGPVHEFTDAVTKNRNFAGTHVSQAARVEPITPAGQVYASQAFAALVEFGQVQSLRCQYVGQQPLAKGYGVFPTYHVERRLTR